MNVTEWANNRLGDYRDNYQRMGIKASGNWGAELEHRIQEIGTNINVKFLAPKYTEQLVKGRKQNKNQDKQSLKAFVGWAGSTFLKDWANNKGLSVNPFAVAWKIARKGWEIPNSYNSGKLVENVLTQNNVMELAKIVGVNLEEEIRTEIYKK